MRIAFTGIGILLLLSLIFPPSAFGEEGGEAEVDLSDPIRFHPFNLSAGSGIVILDPEDGNRETFFELRFGLRFSVWKVAVGLDVPLTFNDDGELRLQTYDEPSDWLTGIEYIRFGEPDEDVYLRAGPLNGASLGHGTIISRYESASDFDSPKTGFEGKVAFQTFGFEGLTNNLAGYEVSGARGFVRPLGAMGWDFPILERIALGLSWAGDIDAPDELKRDPFGRLNLDSDTNPRYRDDALSVLGVDLEVPLLEGPFLHVLPYVDQNFITGGRRGTHVGATVKLELPLLILPVVHARAEYIHGEGGYVPRYFDSFYEIDRIAGDDLEAPVPKRRLLERDRAQDGYYLEGGLQIPHFLNVEASYQSYAEDDGRLTFAASFVGLDLVRFRLAYAKRGVEDEGDMFTFDDRTFLRADIYVKIFSFLYLDLRFERIWRFDENRTRYVPVDVYRPGLVFGFSW